MTNYSHSRRDVVRSFGQTYRMRLRQLAIPLRVLLGRDALCSWRTPPSWHGNSRFPGRTKLVASVSRPDGRAPRSLKREKPPWFLKQISTGRDSRPDNSSIHGQLVGGHVVFHVGPGTCTIYAGCLEAEGPTFRVDAGVTTNLDSRGVVVADVSCVTTGLTPGIP